MLMKFYCAMQHMDISNIGLAQLEQLNSFINTATTTWNVASNEKIINGIVENAQENDAHENDEPEEEEIELEEAEDL
ncbi:unnamed protein product [Caenorhabditis nigoni]